MRKFNLRKFFGSVVDLGILATVVLAWATIAIMVSFTAWILVF